MKAKNQKPNKIPNTKKPSPKLPTSAEGQ